MRRGRVTFAVNADRAPQYPSREFAYLLPQEPVAGEAEPFAKLWRARNEEMNAHRTEFTERDYRESLGERCFGNVNDERMRDEKCGLPAEGGVR